MRTCADLLLPILLDPTDDTRRLVYADWLEEHGETARAAFIRVQIELTQVPACERSDRHLEDGSPWPACRSLPSDARSEPFCASCQQWTRLRARERTLAALGQAWWRSEVLAAVMPVLAGPTLDNSPTWHTVDPRRIEPRIRLEAARGFVSRVACALADWAGGPCDAEIHRIDIGDAHSCHECQGTGQKVALGPAIVAAYPVEEVVLTDLRTVCTAVGEGVPQTRMRVSAGDLVLESLLDIAPWWEEAGGLTRVFGRAPRIARESSHDLMWEACGMQLNWARQQADLPPLDLSVTTFETKSIR